MSGKSFKMRAEHKAPVIGESLYLWAGNQVDLPAVHDSLQKRELTSRVDVYQLSTADWSSHLTRGTPSLGVMAYSCTTSHSNICYFGGWCGHDDCYHNTLNVLNTIKMEWTSCSNAEQSLMKKANAGMISVEFDGAEYLVIIGGLGSTPTVYHPQFQYDQLKTGRVRTNEQLLYNVSTGQFTVPSVSGQCCPPTSDFIIEKITTTGNRGVMFGGLVTVNGDRSTSTNSVYIFSVTHSIINWEILKPGAIPNEGLWPMERADHASAIINGDSTSPTLVVIGGRDKRDQLVNECLLFDSITTGQYSCRKIPLPESVTGRYLHSLTAVTMSPHCVWLVIVGGCKRFRMKDVGGGKKEPKSTLITDTNRLIMIIELVYSEAGEWIVQSVLDGNDLTSKNYQEKYQSYNKTRTWWMDQLIEYPTEREMKLQRYVQSLHEDLQVAHESKVSLQEALVEANKQGDDSNDIMSSVLEKMRQEQEKLIEEKQIITGDHEKLKLKIAELLEEKEEQYFKEKQIIIDDNQNLISEKDKVIAKLTSQVEEQSQNEKQIITDLKEKDLCIAKLVKERQERVLKQPIKETSSIGLQFNYLIPSMDKLDCLSDVQVAERKLFLIQGDKPQLMNWEKYGLRIGVEKESLLSSETVEAAVVALVGGEFQFPANTVLVSAVYAVSLSKPLLKRLILEIQHCVDLTGRPDLSRHLKFAIAPVSTPSLPYQFSLVEGGVFSSNSWYGSIERKEFCLVCILGLLFVAMAGILGGGGGGGGGGGQQQQGGGVVPAQQQQGGDALTVLVQQQQPGANEQTNGQQGEEGQEGQQQQGQHEEGEEEQGEGAEVQGEGDQPQEEEIQTGPEEGEEQSGELEGEGGSQQGGEEQREPLEQGLEQQQEGGGGIQEEEGVYEEGEKDPVHNEEAAPPAVACTECRSNINTDVQKSMKYAGLVYYEEKGVEDLVRFTAAKKLDALIQFIERKHFQAEIGPDISFCFKFPYDYIELNFTAPQDEPITGWMVKPHTKPTRLYQEAVDKFGDKEHCRPSSCLISVYGSPDA
uniref:Uncharacterized protein n=1 Tax=Amphimedon queenslandica TaxID=400682 RepID=A0A1X7T6U1_AMPQE